MRVQGAQGGGKLMERARARHGATPGWARGLSVQGDGRDGVQPASAFLKQSFQADVQVEDIGFIKRLPAMPAMAWAQYLPAQGDRCWQGRDVWFAGAQDQHSQKGGSRG